MPSAPGSSADAYNGFAAAYSAQSEASLVNGYYMHPAIVNLARRRLGPGAGLHLADLTAPLPFPDGTFDDVIAALVLHYLEDWTGPLAELRRVLKPPR
jgi:ubiquinone/menaquinone biosynthesis C-methylase UbiE